MRYVRFWLDRRLTGADKCAIKLLISTEISTAAKKNVTLSTVTFVSKRFDRSVWVARTVRGRASSGGPVRLHRSDANHHTPNSPVALWLRPPRRPAFWMNSRPVLREVAAACVRLSYVRDHIATGHAQFDHQPVAMPLGQDGPEQDEKQQQKNEGHADDARRPRSIGCAIRACKPDRGVSHGTPPQRDYAAGAARRR
jgi:hypothetical protein